MPEPINSKMVRCDSWLKRREKAEKSWRKTAQEQTATTNRAKEKTSAGTTPAVNASSCAPIGWQGNCQLFPRFLAEERDSLSYRFAFIIAMFAATLLASASMAQTTAPDSVPNFSAATRLWTASDLKTPTRGRNPVRGIIESKSKSAGRFSKRSFSFSVRLSTARVWLTCIKLLKRGRIHGGMKPTLWQDRSRGSLHLPIMRPDWRWLPA